ncbi:MAG: hypothetical protein P4L42_17730 [Desulfocapsaceae bacterium]|nr:hypothetical protein [Desulfocapsaceae bacterium]
MNTLYINKVNIMELKDYCRNVDSELSQWQGKFNCAISKFEHMSTGSKQRVFEDVNGLHIILTELDDRLEKLRTECPISWRPERDDVPLHIPEFRYNFSDTANVFFDYDFGG